MLLFICSNLCLLPVISVCFIFLMSEFNPGNPFIFISLYRIFMISPLYIAGTGIHGIFTGVTEFMVSLMLTPLAAAFDVTPAQTSWLIAVYTLSYALAAPMLGRLSDRIGRYRMLRAALLLFVADGIALALAPCFSVAVGLRILVVLASAALIPSVLH